MWGNWKFETSKNLAEYFFAPPSVRHIHTRDVLPCSLKLDRKAANGPFCGIHKALISGSIFLVEKMIDLQRLLERWLEDNKCCICLLADTYYGSYGLEHFFHIIETSVRSISTLVLFPHCVTSELGTSHRSGRR